jgi:hypothetical protein
MMEGTSSFLRLKWLASVFFGLLWATIGCAATLAERCEFGHATLAANWGAGRKGKASTRSHNQDLADYYAEIKNGSHKAGAGLPEKGICDRATGKLRYPNGQADASYGSKTYFNTYDNNVAERMTKNEEAAVVDIIKNIPPGSVFNGVPIIQK